MTGDRIKAMLDERPFRPFEIHTSDGKVITVKSPEFAWIHPFGRTMYVCPDPDVDVDEVIDIDHITKLVNGARGGPGRGRRRAGK